MAGRIVLFGATGYTGDLTARALVAQGARPVLAARSADRLAALAAELGGLETAVADVSRPDSVRALVERGDVLVSTVGPFVRFGGPAVEAAVATGAHYLDSTGEGPFIREVFERYGPGAQAAGSGLVTAFGYDWVPGNLAGGLALAEAGEQAVRVEIAYFAPGGGSGGGHERRHARQRGRPAARAELRLARRAAGQRARRGPRQGLRRCVPASRRRASRSARRSTWRCRA